VVCGASAVFPHRLSVAAGSVRRMDLNREPQQMAREGADEIRCLNHRTINADSYTYPGQVATTVEALRELAARLPQALRQMSAGLAELDQADKIRMENDSDPHPHVVDVTQCLEKAERAANSLNDALREAHSTLFSMGMPWESAEDGDDEDVAVPN
jgi:hypothetical protein